MALREQFTGQLKIAMLAGDAPRVSALRMVMAKLKDSDIAARPKGVQAIPDAEILALLRGMVKSRRESVELYRQGNRPELAAKEEAEIAVIEAFLPQQMDEEGLAAAVAAAIAATGAAAVKDMGRVMAELKARHGAALDLSRAGPMVKAGLGLGTSMPASPASCSTASMKAAPWLFMTKVMASPCSPQPKQW